MTERTAKFIKNIEHWKSDAKLFELSIPVKYYVAWDKEEEETKFVIVSAVDALFSGPETYIFPAKKDGEVINHMEMDGSFRGGLDHEQALNDAGFEIVGGTR